MFPVFQIQGALTSIHPACITGRVILRTFKILWTSMGRSLDVPVNTIDYVVFIGEQKRLSSDLRCTD